MMMPPLWVFKLIGVLALLVGVYVFVQRVQTWHESHKALPGVQASLAAELACEKGSTCDTKSEERANKAAADAALAASTAVATALASEEATRREAAAWRARFKEAQGASPECAAWAAQKVGCPL